MFSKRLLMLGVILSLFLGGFLLVQLWFEPFTAEIVHKVWVSCVVIVLTFWIVDRLLSYMKTNKE